MYVSIKASIAFYCVDYAVAYDSFILLSPLSTLHPSQTFNDTFHCIYFNHFAAICINAQLHVYMCLYVRVWVCLYSVPCSIINANDKVRHFITSFYLHISHIRTRTYRQSNEVTANEVEKKNELVCVSMA